ncbi:MAG: amidohydrolase family protein [Rhodospirillaceae bacterium]|jgi:imidazolonepropionase-like amidohydrolase|nr:amidohydrolase family protein [Rhodospirillaceae bacterium]MBT5895630.1 amidohydrolase family protein [Rhodospirillaceae bacterium]MBT6427462.1 amidohydrolase family protein [Rhodospirillaceae bacterium]
MTELYAGGLLYDGGTEVIDGQGVLVEDGQVTKVAPAGEFDGFEGTTIDTTGGTLIPGLFDCHVHLCLGAEGDPGTAADKLLPGQVTMKALERAQNTLAGGITAIRDCGGRDYLEFAVRDAVNGGQQMGPTIRASGRVICMTGGHGNRSGRIADGIDEVVRAVREQIHAGSDLIKIMATGGVMTPGVNPEDAHYTAEEMAAGIAEGRRFHRRSASHAQGRDGILNAVRGGISSIEHGIFMDETCVQEMLAQGTYLVPTVAALRNILDNVKNGIPDYVVEKTERVSENHRRSIQMYYKAGGNIAMGTDAGTPFNKHGANAMELEFMADLGIKPIDALRFGTANSADLMDLPDQGRVAAGTAADFLVVNGNPAEDISMASRLENHRLVIKGGLPVSGQSVSAAGPNFQRMAAF